MNLSRKKKIIILVLVDSMLILLSNIAAYFFISPFVKLSPEFVRDSLIIFIGVYLCFGFLLKVFTRINRFTNLREMIAIFMALSLTAVVLFMYCHLTGEPYSKRFILLIYLISLLLIITSRLTWRLIIEHNNDSYNVNLPIKQTLVVGAGDGGRILINSLKGSKANRNINVVGMVDDDKEKYHTYINGVKVLGGTSDIPNLVTKYNIDMVTVAIPSIQKKDFQKIMDILEPLTIKVNTMPSIEELASGEVAVEKLREIDVVDLLGREEVQLDMESISDQLTNKVILVTGAGGSIGSEICRQVMKFQPKQILLLGHGENSIYLIEKELKNLYPKEQAKIIPIIADIQDRKKIVGIMSKYRPEIVYHAAAHKHVPLMESNPSEAVKNNIYGTKNVAEAAKKTEVKNFVMISTDKAVNPPNVMGSTKRIAEMIVMGLNEEGKTKFSAVRFGNVLGSRGSVIPVFKEQIAKGGPVTVTDFRMTRYFMTIPEASRLVIQSGALARGGEIFILDMGEPIKIVDLAKRMIQLSGNTEEEIQIVESGIRPGEKLYEELLVSKERNPEQVYEKIFIGNVKGFSYNDVIEFIDKINLEEATLSSKLIKFANESSK